MDKPLDQFDNSIKQFQDIVIKRKVDGPFGNIFGENQSGEIVCIYCKILIEKSFLSQHCGEAQHLEEMFKQIEDQRKLLKLSYRKIWNFQVAVDQEKRFLQLHKRDYRRIYKNLKNFFEEIIVESGIFNNCQERQKQEQVRTISKLHYYLLVHNIEFIKGEDIVKFVQDEQNVNVQALEQYAQYEEILLSDEQLEKLREINFSNIRAPDGKFKKDYVKNLYKFIKDTLHSGYEEVALVMNLQLASKISQEEIFHLNYDKIKKSDKNFIIELQNKKILTFDRECLISELQKIFWDNIGKHKNVIGEEILFKRNKINEAFNQARISIMNNLGSSESEKIYKNFLQEIQLMDYKKCYKSNIWKFNLIEDEGKSKIQKTQEKVQQSKYYKVIKQIIQVDESIEISNDQFK